KDSSAEGFAFGGRSILISLMSFNLLAIICSISDINHCFLRIVAQSGRSASVGLTPAFSGATNGGERTHKKCAARPPLQRIVMRRCRSILSIFLELSYIG